MVKRGEIDPWNIDVVDVTDKFLKRVEEARELDLRISGRVLLYAAILVRMKAEAITYDVIGEEEEYDVILDEVDFSEFDRFDEFKEPYELKDDLDEEIILKVLRTPRKKIRKISTLKELIYELRRAEIIERRRRTRKRYERGEEVEPLMISHDESMEETIALIEQELLKILANKRSIMFSSLVKGKKRGEVVDYYISILHLAFKRRVELYQERFYDDIEIKKV